MSKFYDEALMKEMEEREKTIKLFEEVKENPDLLDEMDLCDLIKIKKYLDSIT